MRGLLYVPSRAREPSRFTRVTIRNRLSQLHQGCIGRSRSRVINPAVLVEHFYCHPHLSLVAKAIEPYI